MDATAKQFDLAHAAPFRLGRLWVEPSRRLIRVGTSTQIVEPRVMQLLIALHDAEGAILSRDDLIEQCWNGRFVGDNAIQRAVSRARKIAQGFGGGSFDIETIRGVGYRLRSSDPDVGVHAAELATKADRQQGISRRRLVTAVCLTTAAAAGGGSAFFFAIRSSPTPMALKLYSRAEAARREQEDEISLEQAVALYYEALRESPRFGEAWSGLALAYCRLLDEAPLNALNRITALATSASNRALELDSTDLNARLSRVLIRPSFRRWSETQSDLARLSNEDSTNWQINAELGQLAADTGRHQSAVGHYRRALEIEPLLPRVHAQLVYSSWAAGRLHEAEELSDRGMKRWPRSWLMWSSRFQLLALAGDTEAASRHLENRGTIPWNLSSPGVPKRLQLVRALESRDPEEIAKAAADHIADARRFVNAVPRVVIILAALDQRDDLFALLHGYYFGTGIYAHAISPLSRRRTSFLFLPPMREVHSDPRFESLLAELGISWSELVQP